MVTFIYENNNFNGTFAFIFRYFTNYTATKIIDVSASSTLSGRGCVYNIINPYVSKTEVSENWISDNDVNSSVTIRFLEHHFKMTSYSMKSRQDKDYNNPYEFVLQASNDEKTWTEIHHKLNDNSLIGKGKENHWNCPNTQYFSIFKLTMLNTNSYIRDYEKYMFTFSLIEFFGTLIRQSPLCKISCKKLRIYRDITYFYWILII